MQFRDHHKDFVEAGAVVFGVSRDNMASHDKFKHNLELPFELIADTEEKLCHMFGVVKNKIMYGKKVKGIERSTFLIDPDGLLRAEWRGIKVAGHVEEVLQGGPGAEERRPEPVVAHTACPPGPVHNGFMRVSPHHSFP